VLKNRDKKRRQTTALVPAVDGSVHAVAPEVAVSFLKETMPFKELSEEALSRLALHCKIDFYPKGTRIMTYN
jgi:CBS domain-containing protein